MVMSNECHSNVVLTNTRSCYSQGGRVGDYFEI